MTKDEIRERAERMGRKGVDMRTAILDAEDRLGRPMTQDEHMSFYTGWKSSAQDREVIAKRRDQETADAARKGTP